MYIDSFDSMFKGIVSGSFTYYK